MSGAHDEVRRAAYAARYGELTDTYTWNLVADAVLAAAAPLVAAGERERVDRAEGKLATILEDLAVVLAEAEPFIGGKDNAAFTRLAEAAGVA